LRQIVCRIDVKEQKIVTGDVTNFVGVTLAVRRRLSTRVDRPSREIHRFVARARQRNLRENRKIGFSK
jgi:hypothetical protein